MNKSISIIPISMLLFVNIAWGQANIKHSKEERYTSGKIKSQYKDGINSNGEVFIDYTSYFEEGGIQTYDHTLVDKNNITRMQYKTFFRNGQLRLMYFTNNGKKVGEEKKYYENGKIESITLYKDDKKSGELKTFHDNGRLKSIQNYQEDLITGEAKEYYQSGKLLSTCFYEKGKRNGELKVFYESSQIKLIRLFKHGEFKINDDKMFDENGIQNSSGTMVSSQNINRSDNNGINSITNEKLSTGNTSHRDPKIVVANNKDFLFVGLDNLITIEGFDDLQNIIATITKGKISKTLVHNKYVVKVDAEGETQIIISSEKNQYQFEYKCVLPARPKLYVGSQNGGRMAASVFKSQNFCRVVHESLSLKYEIVSAEITFSGYGFLTSEQLLLIRNDFKTMENIFARCGPGTNIEFKNIKVKSNDISEMLIDDVVFNLF